MSTDTESMRRRAEIFKALGHPSRLAMIVALGQRTLCVNDLQQRVGSDISTVSKHLSVLRAVGLIESDKQGKQVFYSLRLPCILEFLECADRALEERG